MTLASYLSCLRIILILPIICLTYFQSSSLNYIALIIFIIASLTDYLDGFIARRTNSVTALGALLDLLADKLLVCILLTWLIFLKSSILVTIPSLIIISRELTISSIRQFLAKNNTLSDLGVTRLGKSKTTFQLISIGLLIISLNFGQVFYQLTTIFIWISALLSLFSLLNYLFIWKNNPKH